MTIKVNCIDCGKVHEIKVIDSDYQRYLNGEGHVQDIFPYLSAGERELLISGLCDKCWDRLLNDDTCSAL